MDLSSPSKYVLATNNPEKKREIMPLFHKAGLCLCSPADFGIKINPRETGKTFHKNAEIKAMETYRAFMDKGFFGNHVFADDSGFEVEALGGIPGVDSAFFLGEGASYEARNKYILQKLENAVNRRCRYVCVICYILPSGESRFFYGEVVGEVARDICGAGGFGYDPIFYLPEYKKTVAQLDMENKNKLSHRGKAIRKFIGAVRQ